MFNISKIYYNFNLIFMNCVNILKYIKSQPLPFEAIPGPKPSLPFIGTNWIYFPFVGYYQSMKLHEANLDKYRRYGPIMKEEYQRGYPSVTVFDPSDIREVFMHEGTCPSRPVLPYVIRHRQSDPQRYPNVGLANMMGQEWLELRSQLAPLLLSKELKRRHIGSQNRVSTRLVNYIKNLLPSNPTNNAYYRLNNDNNTNTNYNNDNNNNNNRTNNNNTGSNSGGSECDFNEHGGLVPNIQEVFYRFSMESIMNLCINQELGCLNHQASSPRSGGGNDSSLINCHHSSVMNDGELIFQAAMDFFEAQHKLYYGLSLWKYYNTKPYRQLCDSQNTIHDIASKYIDVALVDLKGRKGNQYHKKSTTTTTFSPPQQCPHQQAAMAAAAAAPKSTKTTTTTTSQQHELDYADEDDERQELDYDIDGGEEHESLLETLYSTNKFNDLEIKSTIVDFIGGGIYTVANTLTMALFLLASNPSVQEQLYQEICQVFKDETNNNNNEIGSDINIDMEKLDQLKFLKLCLKESYRLLPTIPGIARTLQKDLVLSNYVVPKNTLVFCNFMVTCRLPQYFQDPDSYNPSRWERTTGGGGGGGKMKGDLAFSLLPFGHGVRKCIGHNFAELEIYVALAKLIRSFKVRTVNGEDAKSLDLSYKFIVVPERPVSLRFVPRNNNNSN